MKRIAKVSLLVAVVVTACLVIVGCGSAASASYKLDRDKSIKTEWGAVAQYKIDSNWEEKTATSLKSHAITSYKTDKDKGNALVLDIANTGDSSYKYSSDSTYGDWLDSQENIYMNTKPEEMAEAARAAGDTAATADDYPTYSNYKMEELGAQVVDGLEWRLYKMSYTRAYTDAKTQMLKEKDPNFQQSQNNEVYYAIIKDGTHDFEVYVYSNQKLLKDFLDTLTVKW